MAAVPQASLNPPPDLSIPKFFRKLEASRWAHRRRHLLHDLQREINRGPIVPLHRLLKLLFDRPRFDHDERNLEKNVKNTEAIA